MRWEERAFIVVTHYQRLLNYIVPDFVHVLSEGRLVKSGGRELALELEEKGYGWLENVARSNDGADPTDRSMAAGRGAEGDDSRRRRAGHLSRRARAVLPRPWRGGAGVAEGHARRRRARRSNRPASRRPVRRSGASRTSSAIATTPFRLAEGVPTNAAPLVSRVAVPGSVRLVLLNGRFAPELSDLSTVPVGLKIGSLAAAIALGRAGVLACWDSSRSRACRSRR